MENGKEGGAAKGEKTGDNNLIGRNTKRGQRPGRQGRGENKTKYNQKDLGKPKGGGGKGGNHV